MSRILVALYDTLQDARDAVDALTENGFYKDNISLIARDENGEYSKYIGDTKAEEGLEGAAVGAGIGAVLGGLGGVLLGLVALAIPGVGPIIAAGPIAAGLAGAGIGAAAGGLLGALTGVGIPEEEANYYVEGVRRGGTLVTVEASDQMAARAIEILNRFNPIDLDERATEWGMEPRRTALEDEDRLDVQTGRVRAHTYRTERTAGMDRMDFPTYEPTYQEHFQERYSNMGSSWEQYRPAYYYGYELAHDDRYRGRDWSTIESEARRDWELRHADSLWDDFKDAVRAGWETVTGRR